ncbi:MAG: hypothetical protein QW327_00665 [Candidatus Odinarchaeota archaeon]
MEELIRISLTIPKNILQKLDEVSPNRSSYITQLLKENFQAKKSQQIILEVNSRKTLKQYLDPKNKYHIDINKLAPVLAVSIKTDSSGPKISLLSFKYGSPILFKIDLSPIKYDEELINDSGEWLRLIDVYSADGEFIMNLLNNNILIVDEIKL